MSVHWPINNDDSFNLSPTKYPDLSTYIYGLDYEGDENDYIHTSELNPNFEEINQRKGKLKNNIKNKPIEIDNDEFKELVDSGHFYKTKHDRGIYEKKLIEFLPKSNLKDTNKSLISDTETKKITAPIRKSLIFDANKSKNVRGRMDWNHYHRLDVIHNFIDDLESQYPSVCTSGSIGKSIEGRDLKILKISNSDASNACVWMDAGIHAREWIAPATATYVANHIATNFADLPHYMTNKDWYFLPVLNPDGYEYSHTTDRMWRKNRARVAGHCVGVDLNRNFSYGWGLRGSSSNPNNNFFRGPEPFSEPESSALRDMIKHSGLKFKVYITLHSYGQVILFPFAFREEICPDYIRLLEGATIMSKAIYEASGNTYKVGISRDVMYGAAGTSNDWSYGAAGIPFCYLIELRSKKHKFRVPKEEIELTGKEILSSVKALMEFVDSYKAPTVDRETFKDWEEFSDDERRYFFLTFTNTHTSIEEKYLWLCAKKLFKVAPPNKTTQVWEVMLVREGQRYFLKTLDTVGESSQTATSKTAINIWKEEHSTMDIMVEGPRASSVAGMLHQREIPFSVAIGDLGLLLEREKGTSASKAAIRRSGTIKTTMNWQNYHRLDVIYAFLDNLVAEYPYLCSVSTIGKTFESREIKMLKISNGNSNNVGVWLDASIHPREWISTAVVTYIADKLVKTFNEQPDTVTNKDWYIVPVLNPDGYEYTHTHDRMWRKNRSRYGECVGVDLNRNFSYGFGEKGEEGSSEDPGNIFYRGPEPFSERETTAIKNVITDTDANFKVFLSFHSYGEVIIFPWGYTEDPCPDYVELLEGGTAMAKAIHDTSGHTYKVGSTKDLMYYAAGTSSDWAYAVAGIPYSYMVELRGKTHRFLLPKEEIVSTAVEVMSGVLTLMDFVDRRCRSTQSCSCPK